MTSPGGSRRDLRRASRAEAAARRAAREGEIARLWGDVPSAAIAASLGMDPADVRRAARRLGLPSPRRAGAAWSAEDSAAVAAVADAGGDLAAWGAANGRSLGSIKSHLQYRAARAARGFPPVHDPARVASPARPRGYPPAVAQWAAEHRFRDPEAALVWGMIRQAEAGGPERGVAR